jgi:PhoH-like ATPase
MSPVVLADSGSDTKVFVLDTNVLMHDPSALFKFQEHHVYLPMTVLEELDNAKIGVSEVARNVRQTNRFIIEQGLQLSRFVAAEEPYKCSGRLFFQTEAHGSSLPESLPGNKTDNSILNTIIWLKNAVSDHEIVLISKDINLRIKATILGIKAEDYANDRVVDDLDLLFSGSRQLASDFWEVLAPARQRFLGSARQADRELAGRRQSLLRGCQRRGRGMVPQPVHLPGQ